MFAWLNALIRPFRRQRIIVVTSQVGSDEHPPIGGFPERFARIVAGIHSGEFARSRATRFRNANGQILEVKQRPTEDSDG